MAKTTPEIDLAGIRIEKRSSTPIYAQLYNQFREMILSGRLRPGDRLPSTRILAADVGVSRTILTQSFEQLILEGYLTGKTGSGTFVASVVPDKVLTTARTKPLSRPKGTMPLPEKENTIPSQTAANISAKEEIIPFQRGCPSFDFFPYKTWQQVGNRVLKNLKHYHLGYEDALGYLPLREEIASYLRVTRAVNCDPEQVVVVTGSQQGLNLVIETFLNKGDEVLLEDPGYQGARVSLLRAGLTICPVPVETDGINVDYAIETFPGAKLAFITPSHQYPLGYTLSLAKRLQLLDWARSNGTLIFEDDYDSEFRYSGKPLASLQGLDTGGVVIYAGTFSKVLFPGLRISYLVLPSKEWVDKVKLTKAIVDRQSPILDQMMLAEFMKEGHFLRHIRKMRLLYAERQQILLKLIHEELGEFLQMEDNQAGMNLTGWLSPKIDIARLKEATKAKGLVISYLDDYTMSHFRRPGISLGYTAFSKYRLKMGVEKLKECIEANLLTG